MVIVRACIGDIQEKMREGCGSFCGHGVGGESGASNRLCGWHSPSRDNHQGELRRCCCNRSWCKDERRALIPCDVKTGDTVLLPEYSGTSVKLEAKKAKRKSLALLYCLSGNSFSGIVMH